MGSRRGVVFLVALLTLYAPSVASATFPGANGSIAFERTDSSFTGGEIFTVDSAGGSVAQLTDEPNASAERPSWSPDGRTVAYAARVDDDPENAFGGIYLVNADGSGRTKVFGPSDSGPAWSPDGSKLAFTVAPDCLKNPACPEQDLYTVNRDGTGLSRLTQDNGLDESLPDWSPDGARIAFSAGSDIWTIAPNGSAVTKLTSHGSAPSWSPDGTRIAFAGVGGIYFMGSTGDTPTQVTVVDSPNVVDGYPSWSPDGTKIAFTRFTSNIFGSGSAHLWTVHVDGSGATQITDSPRTDIRADWQPLPGPRRADYQNAAHFCKAERDFLGDDAFRQRHGGGANAYGRCVSGKR